MEKFDKNILVAGTFNNDLESGRRMELILDEFKPDVIVGETNQLFDLKSSTRELVWAVLFDECEVPQDLQEKWRAIQTHKEHLAAQNYAHSKRAPYFMIDTDSYFNPREVNDYAQAELVKKLQKELTPEEIIGHLRQQIERRFYRLQRRQEHERCERYYSENFLCEGNRPKYAESRGAELAREFAAILETYPNSRIFGFFDGTQIINPNSKMALSALGRPMRNLRYCLGNNGVRYNMLIDLI